MMKEVVKSLDKDSSLKKAIRWLNVQDVSGKADLVHGLIMVVVQPATTKRTTSFIQNRVLNHCYLSALFG